MKQLAVVGALALATALVGAQTNWVYFGQDQGATRYSTLSQITTTNVTNLKRAWTFHTGDKSGFFESTPLVIDSVMYFARGQAGSTPSTRSRDSRSGRSTPPGTTRRGVSYWPGDATHRPARSSRRPEPSSSRSTRRPASPSESFGEDGTVELDDSMNSPAAIYKDLAIVPGEQAVDPRVEHAHWQARVDVQPHSAARRTGHDTWEAKGWKTAGGTNVWGLLSLDASRCAGLPARLDAGRERLLRRRSPGDNLYGTSVVALDAEYREAAVVPAARPPRHLGLRPRRRADARRRREGRAHDSGGRPDHEDGTAVRARSDERRADLGDRGTAGTADDSAGREDGADAAVSGQAGAARAQFDEEGAIWPPSHPEHEAYCRGLWDKYNLADSVPYQPWNDKQDIVLFPGAVGGGNWNGVTFNKALGLMITNVMNAGQWGHLEPATGGGRGRRGGRGGQGRGQRCRGAGRACRGAHVAQGHTGRAAVLGSEDDVFVPGAARGASSMAVSTKTGDIAWHVPLGTFDELEGEGHQDRHARAWAGHHDRGQPRLHRGDRGQQVPRLRRAQRAKSCGATSSRRQRTRFPRRISDATVNSTW